ncbi:hypothetical protein ACFQMH_06835 [Streptomyces viridiviolaceus]|uniref:Transposase n=2 Tax=Streptomyces viridiviolaceus TaxID=68282 RepID=A0ABW2DY31_9ACTN
MARRLRVSLKSACQWHQPWRDGGVQALASRGPRAARTGASCSGTEGASGESRLVKRWSRTQRTQNPRR